MASKASGNITYYANHEGPVIGTFKRKVIHEQGLHFKDIDGSGTVSRVNDWRLPPEERARAYVCTLSVHEKIGQLFISDWRMGPKYPCMVKEHVFQPDESGVLDDAELHGKTIFGEQHTPGTTTLLKEWFARNLILRANPSPEDLVDYMNQLHAVAEECDHFVPVSVASNSRNENAQAIFGMNDAAGVFAAWPGTMGIAAAIKGAGIEVADRWADCIRREWNACGLRKGYMYMADVLTDPRWQRSYGTFGEDPQLIYDVMSHIIPRIQGSPEGVTEDGVAVTTKHFPGGGARENGFDPHYKAGQWNVYQTEGSLQKYHLPGFMAAVEQNTSAVMPYYSKPAKAKSAQQLDRSGKPMKLEPYGFAYNKYFIDTLLREQMGFKGYINSDTGIVHNMCWGVEMLDKPERIAFAINYAGVDVISGLFDQELAKEAYERAENGYYDEHPVPEGFSREQLVLTDETIDRAVIRTLTEKFELGMFENPFRDAETAKETVSYKADWEAAALAHRQSVVLLKNDGTLPAKAEAKRVYAEAFAKDASNAAKATAALHGLLKDLDLTDDPAQADLALLMITPSSGAYFSATPGYLELEICEGKTVCNVDVEGRPSEATHLETTLAGAGRIAEIAQKVHANGGKVIANVNVTLAWMLGNVEPYADALTVGFDTYPQATLEVIWGRFAPVGKLPVTLPRGDEVLAVSAEGVCISPNDVPGYDKDQYIPESLKDENGKAYAYRDAAGNYYELNFGLSY